MRFFSVIQNHVSLFGLIGPFADIEEFAQAIGVHRDLQLEIDCIGGSAEWVMDAYGELRGRVSEATVKRAYSAAVIVALASPHIRIECGGGMMIHAPRYPAAYCDHQGLIDRAKQCAETTEQYERIVCDRTGLKSKIVHRWLTDGQDHYFDAEQCVTLGLADEVIEPPAREEIADTVGIVAPATDNREQLLLKVLRGFGRIQSADRNKLLRDVNVWANQNIHEA